MKRILAGAMLLILLICGAGCRKEEESVIPLTQRDHYEVTANGRTYTTDGCPFLQESTEEKP